MRVEERRSTDDEIDGITYQLILDDFLFGFYHMVATLGEILEGDVFLDPVAGTVKTALPETRKEKHRFAQRFAGNGAGVDADTSGNFLALDDTDLLADFGSLDRRLLARGAGTDD